jgi:uncharacterized protein YbjT (DUF2867 family)
MVLVTGATGNVGSAVVRALVSRGVAVRAFVRDAGKARELLGDDAELAVGDLSNAASIRSALDGVERIFLSSADGPEKVAHETAVVDAAAAAGAHLIVKCSTIGAAIGSPMRPFDWHGRIEEHLRRSDLPAVFLHSCFYMTNLLASAEQVRHEHRLFAPAGQGRIAMIDPRDTAAVAAVALTEDGHRGRTYVLTGPQAITYAQVAEELSRATGEHVEFVDVPDEAARQALVAAGMPDWLVEHLGALFPFIREGGLEPTTDTVHALTGREPRAFAEFAENHAHAFGRSVVAESS